MRYLNQCLAILFHLIFLLGFARAESGLIELLEARLEIAEGLSWSFKGQSLTRPPVDWSEASLDSDALAKVHREGVSSFKPATEGAYFGVGAYSPLDGRMKFSFTREGRKYVILYDGESFAWVTPTKLADESAGADFVEISSSGFEANIDELGLSSSGFHFAPFRVPQIQSCFATAELSISLIEFVALLRSPDVKKAVEATPDGWRTTFEAFVDAEPSGDVVYEFDKQGRLGSVRWIAAPAWSPSETITLSYSKESVADLGPESARYINWSAGFASRFEFESWSAADPSEFQIELPSGATVIDHVHQLAYTNVEGAAGEARAAQLYALQHNLELAPPAKRINFLALVLGGLTLIGVGYLGIRKWRYAKVISAVALALSVTGCEQGANTQSLKQLADPGSFKWEAGSGWCLTTVGGQSVYVSQCGSKTTLLALEMANFAYDPLLLSKLLPPTTSGISMADIKIALEAHGYDVDARKDLSIEEVVALARKNELLLVHIPQYQHWEYVEPHYVLVSKNSSGTVMLLDPPKMPLPLSDLDARELDGLTVLLCNRSTRDKKWFPVTERVEFTPSDFKAGNYSGTVELANAANHPTAILRGDVSCNCIELEFEPFVLMPQSSKTIRFTINKMTWGQSTQQINFYDATGNTESIHIAGSSIALAQHESQDAQPKPIEIRKSILIPRDCGTDTVTADFTLKFPFAVRDRLHVAGDNPLSAVLKRLPGDAQDALVRVELQFGPETVRDVSLRGPQTYTLSVLDGTDSIGTIRIQVSRSVGIDYTVQREADGTYELQIRSSKTLEGWQFEQVEGKVYSVSGVEYDHDYQWRISLVASDPSRQLAPAYVFAARLKHDKHCVLRKKFLLRNAALD